jgi:uncharacterized protein (DUF433 family)
MVNSYVKEPLMIVLPEIVVLPLKLDEHGAIRVSDTRVTLDTIIAFYHQGESPEDLHDGFPTIPLADIYGVIAYYLAHQAEVDAYLRRRSEDADRVRQEWETQHPPPKKAELMARLDAKRRNE